MLRLLMTVLILTALLPPFGQAAWAQSTVRGRPQRVCVTFKTPTRILAGQSFVKAIGGGLEVRLRGDPSGRWQISAGPVGTTGDYLWVVSPPFQTAPQIQIGAGYNLTARESVQMSPRRLRFVTSATDYEDASALADRAMRDASAGITTDDLTRLGKGSLELWVTGFGLRQGGDGLTWISARERACQPR